MPDLVRWMRRLFVVFALPLLGCGCGGGGGGPQAPAFVSPAPTPSPSPSPPPAGTLSPSRGSAAFTLTGQQLTVILTEPAYADTVIADATGCGGVATVTPSSASAPATFTITAQASGACNLAFSDRFGQRATVAVGVTVTQGTLN
jgi:hypothetical protein